MPKPKTSPDLTPKPYRLLKTDLAAKLSPRSQGGITYVLLADTGDAPDLYIAVIGNEAGGLWSKEAVPLDRIKGILDAYAGQPFPTKALRGAMTGKSSNNPPFCLAVLKDLGLVEAAPEKAHQHVKAGDWLAFRQAWLAKPGEPVMYPAPRADGGQLVATVDASATEAATASPPAEPVPAGKGKKRRKGPEDEAVASTGDAAPVEEVAADGTPGTDIPLTREADHAPTAHA